MESFTTSWSNGWCQESTSWTVWWTYPCASEGRYRIKVLFNGSLVGQDEFSPTRYTPVIYGVAAKDSISPKLLGDNFASKYMQTINPESTLVFVQVAGIAGNKQQCLTPLPDATVKISNTITPSSGGHDHFSSNNELGTGTYTPLGSSDILDPGNLATNGTVIEGKSLSDGSFYTFYTAGDFGVNETLTVEARRDATTIDDERKSDPVTYTIDIKAPNLVELPEGILDGQFSFRYGGSCVHNPTARWVVSGLKTRLIIMDALYKNKFGHRLSFNDASVKFGGVFDNGKNGGRDSLCHKSHRRGNDIDVNSADEIKENIRTVEYLDNKVSRPRLLFVTDLAEKLGLKKVREEGSIHYRYINY